MASQKERVRKLIMEAALPVVDGFPTGDKADFVARVDALMSADDFDALTKQFDELTSIAASLDHPVLAGVCVSLMMSLSNDDPAVVREALYSFFNLQERTKVAIRRGTSST